MNAYFSSAKLLLFGLVEILVREQFMPHTDTCLCVCVWRFLLLLLLSFKNLFELFLFSSQSHRFVPLHFVPLVALVKRVTELITLLFFFKCRLNEIEG